jgi:adenine/guanine phosphoribosyltransferase-like PRPP-binding protein
MYNQRGFSANHPTTAAVTSLHSIRNNSFGNSNHFFAPKKIPHAEKIISLGNVRELIPLTKMPKEPGYFLYFKLNDHPQLVKEGARLVAEYIHQSGLKNPYFVTIEASTLALAHVLRDTYQIEGMTIYKNTQLNDVDPVSIEYGTVTSKDKKTLYLGRNRLHELQNREIILLDSIVTKGSTLKAVYELLIKAGVRAENIAEAIVLFNEGAPKSMIEVDQNTRLKVHTFSSLPLFQEEEALTEPPLLKKC